MSAMVGATLGDRPPIVADVGQPRCRATSIASSAISGFTLRSSASRQASTASSLRSADSGAHSRAARCDVAGAVRAGQRAPARPARRRRGRPGRTRRGRSAPGPARRAGCGCRASFWRFSRSFSAALAPAGGRGDALADAAGPHRDAQLLALGGVALAAEVVRLRLGGPVQLRGGGERVAEAAQPERDGQHALAAAAGLGVAGEVAGPADVAAADRRGPLAPSRGRSRRGARARRRPPPPAGCAAPPRGTATGW